VSEGRDERLRDLWLPVLVGVAGLLIALTVWGLLVANRRAEILAGARDMASESRAAVESGLQEQIETLRGLQSLWRTFGLRPLDEWKANVGQRVDRLPGVNSVAWVDLDEPRARIAVGRGQSAAESELDDREARLHPDAPHLAGPERDASGAIQYRILLPVRTPEDHAGVLVARVSAAPFLENVLRARARGYALSVFWGEQEIFSRGTPVSDPRHAWWRVEESVGLPLGAQWRVVHRPTPEFATMRLTPVLHYLLAVGVLLSVVLALVVYQLRLIVRQSRFLAASNYALEQRGAELETRVTERTAALEEAVAELEAFNYSVSHDLRSPLAAILNFTAILEEDYPDRPLDAEGIKMLSRIRRSATRATALLEDLLQLSRAGRAAMTFEPVDMTTLARETFAQVRAAEGDEDVEFVVDELPEAIGDRILLGDVFANLFSNAVKYSRGCEKRRITVTGRSGDGEQIYEVADNGHGFDMRFKDKLFALFERLHADDDIEGTGVGLAMVSRIVKRHGGRVWAEGRPGEGARFCFALPRKEPS
jgi:signal transduction histidine kinase